MNCRKNGYRSDYDLRNRQIIRSTKQSVPLGRHQIIVQSSRAGFTLIING
jgi:hypothetical protein